MSHIEMRVAISAVNTKNWCVQILWRRWVGQKNLFWIVDPHNPWDDSYDDDEDYEGPHTTHYEDEDDLKYESSTHMPYESYDDDFQLELW